MTSILISLKYSSIKLVKDGISHLGHTSLVFSVLGELKGQRMKCYVTTINYSERNSNLI